MCVWLTKLIKSFIYALEGLKYTIVTQRNMRIHYLVALGVLLLALYLPMSKLEVLILFVTIVLVLFAEVINTAIEAIVDLITDDYHPLAKVAKDVAAGAVLLTAGLAIIVGISVFYPYIQGLITGWFDQRNGYPANIGLAVILGIDFFLTLFIKGWIQRLAIRIWEPSMIISLSCCVATLMIIILSHLFMALLILILLLLLVGTRIRYSSNRRSILSGAILGTLVAVIGIQFI